MYGKSRTSVGDPVAPDLMAEFGRQHFALGDALHAAHSGEAVAALAGVAEVAKALGEAATEAYARDKGEAALSDALNEFLSIEGLMRLARTAHSIGFPPGSVDASDAAVFERLLSHAARGGSMTDVMGLHIPSAQLRIVWAARWFDQGMPRIVWADHKYPEVLMASKADASTLTVVRPPWRALTIDLPPELLSSEHPRTGKREFLERVLVHYCEQSDGTFVWNFVAQGGSGLELWRHGLPTELLLEIREDLHSPLYADKVTPEDDRLFLLLGRLIVGTCLTLSDPTKVREARNTRAKKRAAHRIGRAPLPITRNFVVGAPTTIRVREALQEFLTHGRKRSGGPSVRVMVAGHWKSQPHGPRNSLRKVIFREPYWNPRDESLPAVTREHVVDSGSCPP